MSYHFGAGNLYALNSTNGVPSGIKFGVLQEFSLDISFNQKELYGQNSFPVSVARGQGKVTGKAKNGAITARLWNEAFFGTTASSGQTVAQIAEAGVAGTTTTLANNATFVEMLSVAFADTGAALTRVAAGTTPAAGQYSRASNGTLAFAVADAGKAIVFDYTYTAAGGSTLALTNTQTGKAPSFALVSQMPYEGKQALIRLNQVYAPKLAFGTKLEDFVVPEFDFMCAADAAGNVGFISLPD